MNYPKTASEINDWVRSEINKLKEEGFVQGEYADTYYEALEAEYCVISPGDNVGNMLEASDNFYESPLLRFVSGDLYAKDLVSLVPEDNVDSERVENLIRDGGWSEEEAIAKACEEYLIYEVPTIFYHDWFNQFGEDFSMNEVIAQ